jgi:predicted ATPase
VFLERIERIIVHVEWNLVREDFYVCACSHFGHPTSVFMISVSEVKLTLLFSIEMLEIENNS